MATPRSFVRSKGIALLIFLAVTVAVRLIVHGKLQTSLLCTSLADAAIDLSFCNLLLTLRSATTGPVLDSNPPAVPADGVDEYVDSIAWQKRFDALRPFDHNHAAFSDQRIQPSIGAREKAVGRRLLQHFHTFGIRCRRIHKQQILADRSREQLRVLRYKADFLA